MKKHLLNIMIFGLLSIGIFSIGQLGCGTSVDTTTTTTTVAGGLSICGTINSGTVAASIKPMGGVKPQSVSAKALSGYNVAAVSKKTGNVYFASAPTDSSGSFTISNLPSGEGYYLDILDSNYKLAAPVSIGTSGGKIVTVVTPEGKSEINLGQITYDSNKGAAIPTAEPIGYLDTTAKVDPKSGETFVPKSAGNFGKGSATQITSGYDQTKVDGDGDGLPNIFDADNNGDLIPDEFDGQYTKEALSVSDYASISTYVFTNLKIDFDRRNAFKTDYSEFTIAIGVSNFGKGGTAKTISSVKVLSGPSWISKAKIVGTSNLWSSTSYNVPPISSDVFEVQINGIKPVTDVNAGDILKFRITFSDGTTEDTIKMLNFVFTDIPRAFAYKIGSGGEWTTITAESGDIGSASTSEVYLRWIRPKDENGAEITKAKYTFEYVNSSGGASEVVIITQEAVAGTTLEGGCNIAAQPGAVFTSNRFMVGLCIRSDANDNSAENVYFTKGW